jgi:hypothetical protein
VQHYSQFWLNKLDISKATFQLPYPFRDTAGNKPEVYLPSKLPYLNLRDTLREEKFSLKQITLEYSGRMRLSPFHHPHLTSLYSVFQTPREKPGGSRAALVVGAALEPPGLSPGVSKTELREVKCG